MALVRDENGKLQYVRADGTVAASSRGSWHNKKVTTDQGTKDYNNFLYELDNFQRQMDTDFKSREGKYQSADTLGRTKARTDERIAGMRKKVGQFASYFNTNAGLYDDESVSMVRAQLADAAKFLDSVRDAAKSEQDYWSQWETEDDYNTYSRRASMDIGNSQKNLEAKRAELKKAEEEFAAAQRSSMSMPSLTGGTPDSNGPAAWDRAKEAQKTIEALRREIGLAEVDISEAERIQRSQMYAKRLELPDIDVWAKRGAAIKNPTFEEVEGTWEVTGKDKRESKIGNIVTYSRDNRERLAAEDAETGTYAGSVLYHYMTEDEVKLYNATLAKEGKAAAKEFLDYLMPTLQARYGAEQGKNINDIQNPIAKTAALGFYSLGAGTDQWVNGTKQLFTGETLPASPTQVASQVIQDSLGKTGKLLYGAGTTIGNMLPSIILGNAVGGIAGATAGKVASAVSMGGASAGNTYNQVMQAAADEGYTRDQAMTYAGLVGASEAMLSYLIGGAGNVAGVGEEKLLAKVAGIDNVFARLALSGAIRIGSEEAEELAQLWIEPVLKTLILGTEFEAPTWEEHVETAIITALSTGILEGGSIIGTEINYDKYGKYLLNDSNKYQQSGVYGVIGEALANLDPKSKAYRMAQTMQEQLSSGVNPTYSDVGRLHAMLLYEQGGKNYGNSGTTKYAEIIQNPDKTDGAPGDAPNSDVHNAAQEVVAAETERQEAMQQTAQEAWNQAAVRAFGETGAKAFQTVNDGSIDSEALYAGFAVYHHAGMTGRDMNTITSQYAKNLPEDLRKIAYDAGVQDAAASVKARTEAAATATAYGNDAGVIANDYSKSMDQDVVRTLDRVAKSLGRKVVVEDLGDSNGLLDSNGVIHIDYRAENPHLVVAAHEVTHVMEDMAPAEHKRYRDYVLNKMADVNGGSILELVEEQKAAYAGKQILSDEQAMNELVADYTARMMKDRNLFAEFAKKDRTAAQKLLDAVKKFLQKVKAVFSGNRQAQNEAAQREFGMDISMVEEAAKLWQEALTASQAQAQTANKNTAQQDGGQNRHSFKGYDKETGRGIYEANFPIGTPKSAKAQRILELIQTVWSKKPIDLVIKNKDGSARIIKAQFDPTYDSNPHVRTDASKLMGGNRHGTAAEQRVTLSLADDYYQIATDATYNYSKDETGKQSDTHKDVKQWHYFINDILFQEQGEEKMTPYRVTINVKERSDGHYVYSFSAEKQNESSNTRQTLHADVTSPENGGGNVRASEARIAEKEGNVKRRFSLKTPVEQTKTLVALHNLTPDKLAKALKLGGFPMPSIAVTKADIPHTNFGDITLVMSKDTVDPKVSKKNTVYSADAWTPTFPQVEYEVNENVERELSRKIRDAAGRLPEEYKRRAYQMAGSIEDYLRNVETEEGLTERFRDELAIKALYLADKGETVETLTAENRKEKQRSPLFEDVLAVFEESPDELGTIPLKELHDRYYGDLREVLVKHGKSDANIERILGKGNPSFGRWMSSVIRYATEPDVSVEQVTDYAAIQRDVESRVDEEGYDKWLHDLFSGVIKDSGIYNQKDRFTPSGNRRSFQQTHYPVTLENIAKAMAAQNDGNSKNVSGFYGVKTLRAGTAKRFSSIKEMHQYEGRLKHLSEEEAQQINEALGKRLYDVMDRIYNTKKHSAHSNSFIEMDSIGNILMEIAEQQMHTIDTVSKTFAQYQYKLPVSLATDIRDLLFDITQMPVNMFEAKPERAVRFDEVMAAVIPSDTDAALREELESVGVNVLEYESGNDADRLAKVNSVEGSRFSRKGGSVVDAAAARAEDVDALKRQVEYWKSQVKQTKGFKVNTKDVEKLAKQLMRTYKVDTDTNVLTKKLQDLYDGIATGYYGNKEIDYETAQARSAEIAKILVEDAVETENEMYVEYAELRKYLRSTTLNISAEDSHDIPDFNDFRKRNMGRMRIGTKGTNIDTVYKELATLWPEFFNEENETTPSDQLLRIAEVMEGVYRTQEVNPFGRYAEEAVSDIADEVLAYFFTLPQSQTFADKAAARLKQSTADARLAGQMSQGRQDAKQLRQANDQIDRLKVQLKQAKADAAKLKQTGTRDASKLQKANEKVSELEAKLKQATVDATLAGQMAQGRRDAALLRRSEELVARAKQRAADALAKEKQRGAEAMQKLKDNQAAKTAKTREQRKAAELRGKIIRHSRDMSQKLLRPTDKKHVPEELRGAVAMLLDAINLESQYTIGPDGKRVKNDDGSPTKRTEAFMRLRQEYEKITKSDQPYNLVIDPDLMDNITELSEMRDVRLADMNTEQLATVWSALRAVEASIQSANKAFGTGRFETISEYAEGIRVDNRGRNDRGNLRGIPGGLDKLVNLEMLTPEAYFHRLGETASEIFRMLRSAQDQHITIMEQARRATFRITRSENIEKLEKQIHHVKLSGDREVVMSTAQIMSLYELLKREKAQEHILVGGIRPDALQQKGLKEVARSEPYKVTLEDCMEICGILTKEQMEMADKLQRYLGEELSDLGNQASMEVYGYRKFNEPNYFPIKVDQNQTKSDAAKQAQAATIAGRGFTKSVAPKAKNAVMLSSIFDVYAAHVNDMATYAAWLAPMENLRRIRDFSFWVEGVQTGNVKAIIERVFGKHGNAYLNKLIDDINQGVQAKDGGNLTDGLIGNYKAASVAANLRVFLQQPTSILRALDMIDPKYLAKGAVRKGDFEKVKKYAPIAIWKDWGYFDINTGRQMKNVLFDFDTKLEKVKQIAMAPAGKADSFAWARLWNAVEAEVKDQQSRLEPGSDAFYRAVAERFSEIVDRTQVVDGILQRSQIMRRPDAYAKMTTSFMAEPTKIYNMFVSAAYDLKHASGKENRKKAGKALARTTFSLVTSFAVNAVMQSIADALRDDDKERDYWEKFSEAYVENFFASFNPAGYIPYARDVLSIAQGYDVSRMDMEPVSRVWDAASQMVKALKGEGKYTIAGSSANLLAEASRLLGVPVANLKRDIHGVILTAAIETDNYLLQYRIDKALLNMGYAQNKKNFMDILYNAMVNDDEAYRIIVADMVRNGTGEDDIRNAMENRMKVAQGVTSVADLSSRYLTPNQEKEYGKAYSRVTGTQVWKSATEEQREKLEGNLYDLTVGNGAGEDLREKIEPGRDVGIDEVEYLLYKLAQEVVSEDGNKNTSQAEAEAAAELLTGLSKDEQAWLWQSTNKSWKSKNNPFN